MWLLVVCQWAGVVCVCVVSCWWSELLWPQRSICNIVRTTATHVHSLKPARAAVVFSLLPTRDSWNYTGVRIHRGQGKPDWRWPTVSIASHCRHWLWVSQDWQTVKNRFVLRNGIHIMLMCIITQLILHVYVTGEGIESVPPTIHAWQFCSTTAGSFHQSNVLLNY